MQWLGQAQECTMSESFIDENARTALDRGEKRTLMKTADESLLFDTRNVLNVCRHVKVGPTYVFVSGSVHSQEG